VANIGKWCVLTVVELHPFNSVWVTTEQITHSRKRRSAEEHLLEPIKAIGVKGDAAWCARFGRSRSHGGRLPPNLSDDGRSAE
jgi:hypothetical protein